MAGPKKAVDKDSAKLERECRELEKELLALENLLRINKEERSKLEEQYRSVKASLTRKRALSKGRNPNASSKVEKGPLKDGTALSAKNASSKVERGPIKDGKAPSRATNASSKVERGPIKDGTAPSATNTFRKGEQKQEIDLQQQSRKNSVKRKQCTAPSKGEEALSTGRTPSTTGACAQNTSSKGDGAPSNERRISSATNESIKEGAPSNEKNPSPTTAPSKGEEALSKGRTPIASSTEEKELHEEKEIHAPQKRNGAKPMQIMGHQVVGSMDKSHEDVKMMYEKFFTGEAANIRRALRRTLTPIETKKLLSRIFKVIYDYVHREMVERLANKSLQLAEGRQPPESLNPEDGVGDSTVGMKQVCSISPSEEDQLKHLFKVTKLFTSRHDDQSDFRVQMIERQKAYGSLLYACDLMGMTDDTVERETMKMKDKLLLKGDWVSGVEDFNHAKSIDKGLLDTYITSGVRLALLMVTRIPPMIAVEPKIFDPNDTIQDASWNESDETEQITSMRPILFFSYEGEVAVQGITTNALGSREKDGAKKNVSRDDEYQPVAKSWC